MRVAFDPDLKADSFTSLDRTLPLPFEADEENRRTQVANSQSPTIGLCLIRVRLGLSQARLHKAGETRSIPPATQRDENGTPPHGEVWLP